MSYEKIWKSICKDLENEEHVDGEWIKDTFDLGGYSVIKHTELQALRTKLEASEKLLYTLGNNNHKDKELFDWFYENADRDLFKEI